MKAVNPKRLQGIKAETLGSETLSSQVKSNIRYTGIGNSMTNVYLATGVDSGNFPCTTGYRIPHFSII